eukprot:15349064-Ditylum_brightwellii.AAC.1
MTGVDPTIYIKSQVTNTVWKTSDEITTENAFTNAFDTKQEMMGNGPTKVRVYFRVVSTLCLNSIKYDNVVYNHIRHNNVYIRSDHFKQNNTVSPGIITELHPTLI